MSDGGKDKEFVPGHGAYLERVNNMCVVLVGTVHDGNIGSVARSMHNFGVTDLRLAEQRTQIGEDAKRMAMWSGDIMERAGVYGSLGDALHDIDIAIGTTRRIGRKRSRFYSTPEMSDAVADLEAGKKVALVFGPEDFGLSNEHLDLCNWLVTINTRSDFDSFNLSHAVTVILYEINRRFHHHRSGGAEDSGMQDALFSHMEHVLKEVGFIPEGRDPRRTMLAMRKMISRGKWTGSEIKLFHAFLHHLENVSDD
ncbi:MAG TPA: TrmJ/YjtD family RNA methyltransferase [bacterium]|mgnify:CR=1 FL=1|nr:TrmJ/YjtD family RNA methyltransferase [bacterium]